VTEFVVLGAGPAGLGAAYRLARTGREVTVLERAPRVGGLAGSFDVAGVRVDHGSHRLHPATPLPIMATLRDLLGNDLQRRPRHGRIRMERRFVRFPPDPVDLVRRLPPSLSCRLALDLATSPARRARADTFEEVVRASLGSTLTTRFYAPYVEKLFGVPAHELAGELARRRIGASSARALVRRVLRPEPERGVFYYPRRGYGQLSDALADAATAAGARIVTGSEVVGLHASADGIDVRTAAGTINAGYVLSTLPMPVLATIASAPPDVAAAAARLESRSLTLAYLVLARPQWTEYDAHYFPARDVPMVRVSEPKNYRENRDDPIDVTVLCAEIPGEVGDAGPRVVDALRRNGLPCPDPIAVEVRTVTRAYPVYRVGFERAFDTLDAWASALPHVVSFGRQGLFAHDNTHHALAMAWAAADACSTEPGSGAGVDAREWVEARRRFRAHVVED
jgi:protoporphyrinogen oxidase